MSRLLPGNGVSAKILFIHGFGSCGTGDKARLLKAHFGTSNIIAPDLPIDPAESLGILEHLIDTRDIEMLVGSSLGGFYALRLNARRPIPSVLINPAIYPWKTLAPHVGTHRHWCTGQPFELTQAHVSQLARLSRQPEMSSEDYLVLLTEGDEILDYREAAAFFSQFRVLVEPGDDHRFRHLEHYLPQIDDFRTSSVRTV